MSLPILTKNTISDLLDTHQKRNPLPNSTPDMMSARLGIVIDVNPTPADCAPKASTTFKVGALIRMGGNFESQVLDFQILESFCDGIPASSEDKLPVEAALFPFLFPHGTKFYTRGCNMTFASYLNHRAQSHCSPFSFFKPYLLMMFQMRQTEQLISNTKEMMFEKEVTNYCTHHPGCSQEGAIKHIATHKIPMSMPGTPSWYRDKLEDLKAVVDKRFSTCVNMAYLICS